MACYALSVTENPYDVLGAPVDADYDFIKAAYRAAAFATHPDRNPDNPEAAAEFRRVKSAWDILSDEQAKAQLDRRLRNTAARPAKRLTRGYTPRPGQQAIIDAIAAARTRFVVLSAGTGTGKSYIAAAAADRIGGRSVFLTMTHELQEQYRRDFPLTEIRGMSNYPCDVLRNAGRPRDDCRRGPCHDGAAALARFGQPDPCTLKAGGCAYYDARRHATAAPAVIANYHYHALAGRVLGARYFLVADEAHSLADLLISLQTVAWKDRSVRWLRQRGVDTSFLQQPGLAGAADGAEKAARQLIARSNGALASSLEARLRAGGGKRDADSDQIYGEPSEAKHALAQMDRLAQLARAREAGTPVWEPWDGAVARYVDATLDKDTAERYLWQGKPRVLLMSATITRRAAETLGVPPDDMTVIDAGTSIPADRRPVCVMASAPHMNYHAFRNAPDNRAFRGWVDLIDEIIDACAAWKGVIHVSSYRQVNLLLEHTQHRRRIIAHGPGELGRAVREFRAAAAGAVLLSPAADTGVDFPHGACRWQIIGKTPWERKSRVTEALERQHPGYKDGKAILKIVQQAGRSTRAPDDASAVFIVDAMVRRFGGEDLMPWWPEWFVDAVTDELPAANVRRVVEEAIDPPECGRA